MMESMEGCQNKEVEEKSNHHLSACLTMSHSMSAWGSCSADVVSISSHHLPWPYLYIPHFLIPCTELLHSVPQPYNPAAWNYQLNFVGSRELLASWLTASRCYVARHEQSWEAHVQIQCSLAALVFIRGLNGLVGTRVTNTNVYLRAHIVDIVKLVRWCLPNIRVGLHYPWYDAIGYSVLWRILSISIIRYLLRLSLTLTLILWRSRTSSHIRTYRHAKDTWWILEAIRRCRELILQWRRRPTYLYYRHSVTRCLLSRS